MKKISEKEIQYEILRMEYEKLKTGHYLIVGDGSSEEFWSKKRYEAGNRWWKFWKNKSDFEIIKLRI